MLIEPLFVQQIVDMYSSGKTQKEIVETTRQTYCVVRYWLKKKGLYDPERRNYAKQGINKHIEREKQEAETRLVFSLLEKGFAYLGGYSGRYSTIKLSCLSCGNEFARRAKNKTTECPFCGEKAKAKAEKEKERAKKREEHEKQLEQRKQLRAEREAERQNKLNEIHICKECGREYTLAEYAKREHLDVKFVATSVFCSSECRKTNGSKIRKKYNSAHGKHLKRCIKYGVEYDATVNLDKLIAKAGTRCALCGGLCDKTDYKVVSGVYLFGDNYPSIDHIIPLSKGVKGHTWDNVQVAHRGCNTQKGANLVV